MAAPRQSPYGGYERQASSRSILRQWWPAFAGLALLALVAAFFIAPRLRQDEPGTRRTISAVPMLAELVDTDGGSGAVGELELEFNNGTGEVCYRVAASTLANPFTITLQSTSGVVLDLGTHNTGTIGCTPWNQPSSQAVLSSPESHFAELRTSDGVVMRGLLQWNPNAGAIGSSPDQPVGDDQPLVVPTSPVGQKAGFILPDRESASRWENLDQPLIRAACDRAGIECLIENADGDPVAMAAIADDMIAQGIGVLAIAAIDPESGAEIQRRAAAAGVKNIDYDRLTTGGLADVYVSFDNVAVGAEQANGLIECFNGDTEGKRIIILHGSPTDNNAALVKQGYLPIVSEAGFVVVGEADIPNWDPAEARVQFEDLLTAAGGEIDGVLAANDGMSIAAQSVLRDDGVQLPTTGQDASVESIRALLTGDQCVTIYKPIAVEADSVVDASVALLRGTDPPANSSIADGNRNIPFVQAAVTPVFRDQVLVPIQDGFVDRDQVCEGIEDLCQASGIG